MSELTPEQENLQQLQILRVQIADTIKKYFPVLFVVTCVVATLLVLLIAIGFLTDRTMATAVLAASFQVAFGMIIGFVCVYIGLMMTWFGIDAAYTIKGKLGAGDVNAEGALKSASPGLLFAMGGIILIAVSLYKPIVYQKAGLREAGRETMGKTETPKRILPKTRPPGPSNPTAVSVDQAPACHK